MTHGLTPHDKFIAVEHRGPVIIDEGSSGKKPMTSRLRGHLLSSGSPSASSCVLAAAATNFTDMVKGRGGDPDRVLGKAALTPSILDNPTAAINLAGYCRMLEYAAEETRYGNFGLWYGQSFTPDMLGLIGYIALASPTLGSALENFLRLFPLHQHHTETRMVYEGHLLRLEYRILDGSIIRRRQDAELTMGMFANVVRRVLGRRWAPLEVHFEHVQPEQAGEHSRAFDADVLFAQPTNALVMRAEHLGEPMPEKNMRLLDVLQASLQKLSVPPTVDTIDLVKTVIRQRLASGAPRLEEVAQALQLPHWTLQRRLAEVGLSFSGLVDVTRQELARDYVRQLHVPLSEIALLLGYAEASAFSRAFKGWFGVSPKGYRAEPDRSPKVKP